jgi:hypothetical protein
MIIYDYVCIRHSFAEVIAVNDRGRDGSRS